MQYRRIKGTQDILPGESRQWTALESGIREMMGRYNYHEVRTPVFEQTELFARGIGQLTDIVSKEMYSFQDRGQKRITLKPEMTAPIIRAFLENKLYARSQLTKIFYIAPLFRQENPQAGRLRQFHQFGAECLGSGSPRADVEVIDLAMSIYKMLNISKLKLKINSVGDPNCREPYKEQLQAYIRPHLAEYCEDCRRRFDDNPMRILDCKKETCSALNQAAPKLADNLCPQCREHHDQVKSQLNSLELEFSEDPFLVRGLDYYTRTVFEITSDALGAQNAICGGGRYDLLAEQLGGPPTAAVGFASGMERLLMVLEQQNISLSGELRLDLFVAALGNTAAGRALPWLKRFREKGWTADHDFLQRSVKAQMREANRQKARLVLLLGDQELESGQFSVKNMDSGEQHTVPFEEIMSFISKNLDT